MTVSYILDSSTSTVGSFLRILFRWRGSVWKSVSILHTVVCYIHRFASRPRTPPVPKQFETLVPWYTRNYIFLKYFNACLSEYKLEEVTKNKIPPFNRSPYLIVRKSTMKTYWKKLRNSFKVVFPVLKNSQENFKFKFFRY